MLLEKLEGYSTSNIFCYTGYNRLEINQRRAGATLVVIAGAGVLIYWFILLGGTLKKEKHYPRLGDRRENQAPNFRQDHGPKSERTVVRQAKKIRWRSNHPKMDVPIPQT